MAVQALCFFGGLMLIAGEERTWRGEVLVAASILIGCLVMVSP